MLQNVELQAQMAINKHAFIQPCQGQMETSIY